jgi:hypothetical protein
LDGALRDVVGASLSLPTVESEPTLPARPPRRGPCSCAGPRHVVVPGTSRCPRDDEKQDTENQSEPTPKTYTRTDLIRINIKVDDSPDRRGCTPQCLGALPVADLFSSSS